MDWFYFCDVLRQFCPVGTRLSYKSICSICILIAAVELNLKGKRAKRLICREDAAIPFSEPPLLYSDNVQHPHLITNSDLHIFVMYRPAYSSDIANLQIPLTASNVLYKYSKKQCDEHIYSLAHHSPDR